MMFGDVGHGFINSLVGLLMVVFEKKLSKVKNEMFDMVFYGRYLVLMMSVFSMLVGFFYNDYFSIAFNVFGSPYKTQHIENGNLIWERDSNRPNLFGIDAHWHWSSNTMPFMNSFKMKTAVVIGVTQMLFGLVLKLVNLLKKKDHTKIFAVWLPEFLIMFSFFGFMVFLIIYKWF